MDSKKKVWDGVGCLKIKECMVCLETLRGCCCTTLILLACNHVFHGPCLMKWHVQYKQETCPLCKQQIG
jgi:hypothetical protein